ncbi:MAG: thioesterase family protein [Candidatus Kapaibacterium sp.]|jgi:acyl-CoA thioester hydrolase|nr:thioesterase family protein [Candidatus Kapabacteria bacterium]
MKRLTEEDVQQETSKYKFVTDGQIKFHEVDSFGIVHNIQYFYFFEWARTKYFEWVGFPLNHKTYTAENPIMTVHHEMDYFNPMYFTDQYEILTRVKSIKNSSLIMENIIRDFDGKICVKASVTLVYLSNTDYKPTRIPEAYRNMIIQMEGDDIEVVD